MSGPPATDDIQALIDDFSASGLREMHVKVGDFELFVSRDTDAAGLHAQGVSVTPSVVAHVPTTVAPVGTAPSAPSVPAVSAASATAGLPADAVIVAAPYLGTFYRAPKPGSAAYVEIGGSVTAETEVCLVEVMKLFTAVRAGIAGTVHAVLASDGELVEPGQPLFAIIPD